ncbi:MAG TPA: Hsp20/alpha crystallin family protein [Anaerolineales bacterium]|nr:Hsp20/alpha crystallin family protein [Anaerolineales bacterium]
MPTVIRKSRGSLVNIRRDILQAVSWRVRSHGWSPPTDVYETADAYVARVEVAGMREEDFEVAFEKDHLIISGLRSDLAERRAYHQMEIQFGKFTAVVGVPVPVDVENARAEYKDGFLTVTLPKSKPSQVKV